MCIRDSIKVADNTAVNIGSGLDLQLSHDGSDSYISQNGAGHLYIENNNDDQDVIFRCDDGSGGTTNYFKLDGGDAIIKFEKDTKHFDNVKGTFGNASDLQIYHSGTKSFIQNETGHLDIRNTATNSDIIFQADDGSGSFTTYFQIDGGEVKTIVNKTMEFQDNVKLAIGNSEDLTIDHNATNSRLINYTGNLRIINSANDGDITFESDDGSGGVTTYLTLDGSDVNTTIHTIKVLMPNLPTSDPSNAGQLWNDSGTLKISAG